MAKNGSHDSSDNDHLTRRTLLRGAGAGAIAAVGIGTASGDGPSYHGIGFDRSVNVVEDYGADPTGSTSVNDAVDRAMSEGTLLVFPAGTYRVTERIDITADRVGFLGDGDVVFEIDGIDQECVSVRDQDDTLFQGIDLDIRNARTTGMRFHCRNRFHVENVEYIGRGGKSGQALVTAIYNEGGVGTIRDFTTKHGGYMDLYYNGNGRIGVWAGLNHEGTIRFEGCDFREYGNNALYTSRTPGNIQVRNSYFENNNVCGVRISGANSWVKDSTFVIDHSRYGYEFQYTDEAFNTRGVRIDQAKNVTLDKFPPKTEQTDASTPIEDRGAVVENCEFKVLDLVEPRSSRGAIEINAASQSTTVKDCHIQVDVDGIEGIYRAKPGWNFREDQDTPPKPHWVHVENTTFTGSAADGYGVVLKGADGSHIRDSCFQYGGANRNGVRVVGSTNVSVENTNLNVDGTAVATKNAEVSTSGLTYGDSCPIPEAGTGTGSGDSDSGSGGGSTTYEHELLVRSAAEADVFEYAVAVTGDAEPVTSGSFRANGNDGVTSDGDTTVLTGTVGKGGGDTYRFDGTVTDVSLGGPGTVSEDGEALYTTDSATGGTVSRHELRVESASDADLFGYSVTVTGAADPVTSGSYSANPDDGDGVTANDDGTFEVTGFVGEGGGDTYSFYGSVASATLDGEGSVLVDGTVVSEHGGSGDDGGSDTAGYDHEMTVYAADDADVFEYAVAVTGDAEPVTSGSYRANGNDGVTRDGDVTVLSGTVGKGGGDTYRFDGRVVTGTFDGPATVEVDGTTVPLGDLGMDHHLEVAGSGVETASYEFSVDDAVAPDPDAPSGSVADGIASGTVESGSHHYYFDGEVTAFARDGLVGCFLDGEQVDPAGLGTDTPSVLPNRFVVDNRDADAPSTYSFEVTGQIERSYETGSIEGADTVSGSQVSGSVDDDVDAFVFSGDLRALSVTGNGTIRFDDVDGVDS